MIIVKAVIDNQDLKKYLEEDVCVHIFTVSAAMVGVCLTVIGLIRVIITNYYTES
jgi:hypothetical protein